MRLPLTPVADHEIIANRTTPIDTKLLGPGKTPDFNAYVKHYNITRNNFNDLLATPNLGRLSYRIGRNPERKNLRILIQNGVASLRRSAENDIARVNELKIYAQKLGSQLEFMPISMFIRTVKSSVEHFKNEAASHIATRTEELNQLKSFVSEVSTAIAWTTYELDQLAFQLRTQEEESTNNTHNVNQGLQNMASAVADGASMLRIDDTKVWKILLEIVESFADENDVSKFMSMLLGISTIAWNTLVRKWQEDREPEARRQFGNKLRKASITLLGVRQGLNSLSSLPFPTEVGIDIGIYELWGNVLANMEGLSKCETRLTREELKLVKQQWEEITSSADAMLKLLTLGLSDDDSDPESLKTATATSVPRRTSNINDQMANPHTIREMLSPPKEMDASLKKLQADCKNILREFDTILSIEGLQHLVIDNPHLTALAGSQARVGPEGDNAHVKWPLWDVVKGYRQDYNDLETECRQLIRKLKSYSSLQKIVLPKVRQGGSQNIPLSQYVAQNRRNIGRLQNRAAALEKRHREFNLNWEFLQKALERQLTEEEENFNPSVCEAKLRALPADQKNAILFSALQGIGGLLSFKLAYHTARSLIAVAGPGSAVSAARVVTAAGFGVSVGIPVAACLTAAVTLIGGWLVYTSVQELEKANKLGEALEKLKKDYQKYLDRIKNLQVISTLSKGIHETLGKLLQIFNDLGNNLTECLMHISQTAFFNALKPELIAKWEHSEKLCNSYLLITARGDDDTSEFEASTSNSGNAIA